jgi:POT family proton-dependent oligopeptide transporter
MYGIPEPYLVMIVAWLLVGAWVAFVIFANRKVHPKVLFFLFMVELWERFSYYGMRAFLILFLTKALVTGGFGFEKTVGYGIYAAYGALVYLTPLAGGYLADKQLGFRRAIIWGAILMAAGQFTLSTSSGTELVSYTEYEARTKAGEQEADLATGLTPERGNEWLMFVGLSLLVIGNGFFKPNISSLIGRFYGQGDPRRDGAFTIFYMGINMGAFLAPLTCGTVAEIEGWKYGFMLAGAGMVTGLLIFLYTTTTGVIGHHADPPIRADGTPVPLARILPVILGTFAAVPVAVFLIRPNDTVDAFLQQKLSWLISQFSAAAPDLSSLSAMDALLGVVGFLAIAYMLFLSFTYPVAERQRIWVIVVLLFFTTVFWTFFELAGSALNLFTDENVDKNLFGMTLTASNFQAANALFIMIFAPLFSFMWVWLAKKKLDPPAPIKFAIGLMLLGTGFLVLNLGKGVAVAGIVPAIFLILLYLLHTLGELALSPVGLSLVTKLAPAKVVGFMMGFWFLSSAIAHQAGKWIASETAAPKGATKEEMMELSLAVFNQVGLFAIGSGILLLVISPLLWRWMHGIK